MADSVAAFGKPPLDIQMGTGNPARTAFQTSLVIDTDTVAIKSIYICRAEIKAGLLTAIFNTFLAINYPEMAFFVYLKTIKE